ncbi:hypothetical protein E1B28_007984 [Marasmius oreades]|uniref:Myosin-binding domain-containing protein n=1 Tax=Marasmius oreades TaxID=181124 RepID=A0A9P7UW19_9AGAR|nr:uncharacterized protein E1B28_007984 [Marasmius oreades]KAG7094384.1 hypothetical protein E1B28_007984 [Marasmius oreades]
MAQPVFEDHPLEQYFRAAGEKSSMMPGGLEELLGTFEDELEISLEEVETVEKLLYDSFESVTSAFASQSFSAFVERFKYNVISSSLLSTTLTTPYTPRATSHGIPGNLHTHGHSRSSSTETNQQTQDTQPSHSLISDSHYFIFSLAISLLIILFGAGYYLSSLSLGAFLLYISTTDTTSTVTTPSLDTLNDLISAGNVWDSVVQEVMTTLEQDEKRMKYASTTPTSPRSSLLVALHSTLLTTQNQCDNVRQLLSALASQTELSQLSHMYAPPSPLPSKSSFLSFTSPTASRPFSLPTRRRTLSHPNLRTINDKRATWNGSYASLANAGSPTMQILKRREKRRSDLSALLHATSPKSASEPVTPSGNSLDGLGLEGVAEEDMPLDDEAGLPSSDDDDDDDEGNVNVSASSEGQFGFAALELQRKRKFRGLRVLGDIPLPPTPTTPSHRRSFKPSPNYSTTATPGIKSPRSPLRSPLFSPRSSVSPIGASASRYTSNNVPRHPLSLSALHCALQAAVASKRYACSHLLALRFQEEKDDEAYWEDVRSVMGLMTTTLVDASARLTEALEEVERIRLEYEQPSPPVRGNLKLAGEEEEEEEEGNEKIVFGKPRQKHRRTRSRLSTSMTGFAPMPNHVARFATHVDAISCALNDAREQLEECVASLREVATTTEEQGDGEEEGGSSDHRVDLEGGDQHPALQAYERLRRELGLALRECERGRERLFDVVRLPQVGQSDEEEGEEADLPGLGHDVRSEDSDGKPDSMDIEHHHHHHLHSEPNVTVVNAPDGIDDVTSHLLLTATTEHLPPPGVEQVYEGDSGNLGVFKRERSKLSREERIQMVKKARESGKRLSDLGIKLPLLEENDGTSNNNSSRMERWGPGGEVVQELKDVIWKVGERRRKMADGHSAPPILRAGEVG